MGYTGKMARAQEGSQAEGLELLMPSIRAHFKSYQDKLLDTGYILCLVNSTYL